MPSTPPSETVKIPARSRGRIAVSLQSGFLGFFAHAGWMNALLDSGIRPAKVSGASSGALVASAYAAGMEGEDLREFVLDRQLQRSFREWGMLYRVPSVFGAYLGHGVVTGKRAVEHLRRKLPVTKIEDTPNAELTIGVTNLSKKKRQIIARGDLASYIVASCALSPVIQSQKIDGEFFLDGGFSDMAPFEHWMNDPDIDVVLIHRIVSPSPRGRWTKHASFISCWAAMHEVMAYELLDFRIRRAREAGKQVIVHETALPRPKLIASRDTSSFNYDAAYKNWQQTPSIILADSTPKPKTHGQAPRP